MFRTQATLQMLMAASTNSSLFCSLLVTADVCVVQSHREVLMQQMSELQAQVAQQAQELQQFADSDPEALQRMKEAARVSAMDSLFASTTTTAASAYRHLLLQHCLLAASTRARQADRCRRVLDPGMGISLAWCACLCYLSQ